MMTGLHPGTPDHLQLGAGMFLKNFSTEGIATAAILRQRLREAVQEGSKVMGATRGGGTFVCKPLLRFLEADGVRSPFVGGTVNDGWVVKLTGTLLEITPENMAAALPGAKVTSSGAMTVVEARCELRDSDYIPHLCWVGDTARGAVLIELTGALNVKGAAFTFRDKREGELPFEFQAHAETPDQETAPCRVLFFK